MNLHGAGLAMGWSHARSSPVMPGRVDDAAHEYASTDSRQTRILHRFDLSGDFVRAFGRSARSPAGAVQGAGASGADPRAGAPSAGFGRWRGWPGSSGGT